MIDSATTMFAATGYTAMWHTPHSVNDHSIGCRVIANTPVASVGIVAVPVGSGSAGLPIIDPMSSRLASSITTVTTAHKPSPTGHSIGVIGAARYASASQTIVTSATSE